MPQTRVLFICIGNSCRSPMAEGFARKYGSDVMHAESAGIRSAATVDPLTIKVMGEKNIDLSGSYPKGADEVQPETFDLIVNMSGFKLPQISVPVEEWKVRDPVGQSGEVFRETANTIEQLVMRLILELRTGKRPAPVRTRGRFAPPT
jgi:arsenate reductase